MKTGAKKTLRMYFRVEGEKGRYQAAAMDAAYGAGYGETIPEAARTAVQYIKGNLTNALMRERTPITTHNIAGARRKFQADFDDETGDFIPGSIVFGDGRRLE